MRLQHFETFAPICPVCRTETEQHRLKIVSVDRQQEDVIFEGMLHCANPACQREYPIIDGIPIIVCDIRTYINDNIQPIIARNDLSPTTESILGDCCSQGTIYEATRQHLSSYTTGHYGRIDPQEDQNDERLQSLNNILQTGLQTINEKPSGRVLDIGCSVGGSTFQLAGESDSMVLGLDLNFAMLRVAAKVLHESKVQYSKRQVGLVYERREFNVDLPNSDHVDFWCCDTTALPFSTASIDMAVSLNLLDCVGSPVAMLQSIENVLRPEGHAIIATPYDWSTAATPMELWLGGHSQRSEQQGASEPMLRMLLTSDANPMSLKNLHLIAEAEHLPWYVYLHQRSIMQYDVHLVVAKNSAIQGK